MGDPVLPVEPGGKAPVGWLAPHGLKDAVLDHDVWAGWCRRCPRLNLGIRTGVTVDVLDVDGDAGWDSLDRLEHELGVLPAGPMVLTGAGAHLYFAPSGHGNRVGLADHLDWRGRDGYVIVSPSVHPSGRRYEWLAHFGRDQPLVQPSAWLLALIDPPLPVVTRPASVPSSPDRSSAYAGSALARELAELLDAPVGVRNDRLNAAAFSIGQLIGANLLDAADVIGRLADVAETIGLPGREATRTIESGLSAGLTHPRALSA
jgi:Bifunctional DNA primase/polymerase, N-terminal